MFCSLHGQAIKVKLDMKEVYFVWALPWKPLICISNVDDWVRS